jgi:hypothetical protein
MHRPFIDVTIEIPERLDLICYPDGDLELLDRVAQRLKRWLPVPFRIGPDDHPDARAGLIAHFRSQNVFVVPGKPLYHVLQIDRQVHGLFINGQMFVMRHSANLKESNNQITYCPARTGQT